MSSLVNEARDAKDQMELAKKQVAVAMARLNVELRHKLVDADFRNVTGTYELGLKNHRGNLIEKIEDPEAVGTYSYNNGVTAVVDYCGHIWIYSGGRSDEHSKLFTIIVDLLTSKHGCRVPHSNDGGAVVSTMWPKDKE